MSIAQELEKLISLRDRGELTYAEFGIAKERLLSGDVSGASQAADKETPSRLKESKPKRTLLIAILSTVAATLAAGSAILDRSPLSLLAFVLFAVASTLNWVQVSKLDVRSP